MNILNVEKVSKTYGEKELFNNISLGINSGDKIGLIGVNGTGKSTLLKIITGIEPADTGLVTLAKDKTLGYLSQQQNHTLCSTVLHCFQSANGFAPL